ncbi:MAG: DUF6036 family nucleotidyltransferase [Ilumatobacteraceae bacterium]
MTFDPVEICAVLTEEGVDFVVLGGFAAIIHGSPLPTEDIDVIPSRSAENLERLASALKRLDARIRTADEPIETRIDAAFIRNMPNMLNLATRFGDMDLVFAPAGRLRTYEQWLERSRFAQLRQDLVVAVADLDDVIASKVAANRPKDQRSLPYLESLRDQLD